MKKTIVSLLCMAALGFAATQAAAQASAQLAVEFQGPGGHSNGNYGRTSAVHAAGRAVMQLKAADLSAGSYAISGLGGGNSVNSIASDARFVVALSAPNTTALDALVSRATQAVQAGAAAENAFRGVKAGDLTAGAPADIRVVITRQ